MLRLAAFLLGHACPLCSLVRALPAGHRGSNLTQPMTYSPRAPTPGFCRSGRFGLRGQCQAWCTFLHDFAEGAVRPDSSKIEIVITVLGTNSSQVTPAACSRRSDRPCRNIGTPLAPYLTAVPLPTRHLLTGPLVLATWMVCVLPVQGDDLQTDAILSQLTVAGTGSRVVVTLIGDHNLDAVLEVVTVPPARIYVDLPNVVPRVDRVTEVNRGAVSRIRVALNRVHPPVTRVVLDLDGAATYYLARGETDRELHIIVEVPTTVPTETVGGSSESFIGEPVEPARIVSVFGDRLTVDVQDVPLSDLLEEVARRTGLVLKGHASLNERATVKFEALPIEQGLQLILRGQSYGLLSRRTAHRSASPIGTPGELRILDPPEPSPESDVSFQTHSKGTRQAAAEIAAQLLSSRWALADEKQDVRLATVDALADLGSADAAEVLALALEDGDDEVRLQTVEALGRIGGERAAALLEYSWAADRSAQVRDAAWAILEHMEVQVR